MKQTEECDYSYFDSITEIAQAGQEERISIYKKKRGSL